MRPSRTREERKNPVVYLPEAELKQQLEQQAALKKKTKVMEALQDKAELLNHYEHYKLSTDPKNDELTRFLEQQKNQLNRAQTEFQRQDPEFYEIMKQNEQKASQQRDIKRKDQQQPIFADYMFKKETLVDGATKVMSNGEIEREKRLKLREQERLRRLAGVLGTAYEEPKSESSKPTTAETIQAPSEQFTLPIQEKSKVLQSNNYYSSDHQDPYEEIQNFHKPQFNARSLEKETFQQNENSLMRSGKVEEPNIFEGSIGNTILDNNLKSAKNVNTSIGRISISEDEKKRRYKQELDELVKAKNEQRQGTAKTSTPSLVSEKPTTADSKLSDWEKKKIYAEELMREIVAKEKQKSRETAERRGIYQNKEYVNDEDIIQERNKFSSSTAHRSDASLEQQVRYDLNDHNKESNIPSRKELNSQENDKYSEVEKKRKYKEELDALVQEKKRVQSAKPESRESKVEEPLVKKQDDNFFMHKVEDEEEKRKRLAQIQKQKHAEELKKQMEEKEDRKKREKLRKEQDDLKERDRIIRETEMEKLKHQSEIENEKRKKEKPQSQEIILPIQENKTNKLHFIQEKAEKFEIISEPDHQETNYQERNAREFDHKNVHNQNQFINTQNQFVNTQNQFGNSQSKFSQQPNYYQQQMPYPSQNTYMQPNGYHPNPYYPQNHPMQPMYYPPVIYPQVGLDQIFYQQYGITNQMYQDLSVQKNLLQQLLEEKTKIEKLAQEEKMLLDEYKNKIRDMKLEKYQFEREIEKMRTLLENPRMVDSKSLGDNPHLLALQGLHTQREKHIYNYNRLVQQSQQNLLGLQANSSRIIAEKNQNTNSNNLLFNEEVTIDQSKILRESLPSSSNYVQALAKQEIEKSFLKDVEAFKNLHKDFFQLENDTSKIEKNLDMTQLTQINQNTYFDKILPTYSQNDSLTPNKFLNKSEQNITTNYEFQTANKRNLTNENTTAYQGILNSENPTERNPLVSPVGDTNRLKNLRSETNQKINFEKSPEINFYAPSNLNPVNRRMNEFSAFPQDSVVRESAEYKMNEHEIIAEHDNTGLNPEQAGIKVNDSSLRFDLPLQRSVQEPKFSIFNNRSEMKLEELELKDKSNEFSPQPEKIQKKLVNLEKLEIKMDEAADERSLIIAEDDEEDDDLIDSNDPALLALKASLSKMKAEKFESVFDPYQVVRLNDIDGKRMEGIVEKAFISQTKAGKSVDTIKRPKSEISNKSKDQDFLQSFDPNDFTNTQIQVNDIKKNESVDIYPKNYYPSNENHHYNVASENYNPNRISLENNVIDKGLKYGKNDPFARPVHDNFSHQTKPIDFDSDYNKKVNDFAQNDIDDKLNLRNNKPSKDAYNFTLVNDIYQNLGTQKYDKLEDLASTIDMNDYNYEEIRQKISEFNQNESNGQFESSDMNFSPKAQRLDKPANEENHRRSKMILNRLTKLLEGYSDEENGFEEQQSEDNENQTDKVIFRPMSNKNKSSRYV